MKWLLCSSKKWHKYGSLTYAICCSSFAFMTRNRQTSLSRSCFSLLSISNMRSSWLISSPTYNPYQLQYQDSYHFHLHHHHYFNSSFQVNPNLVCIHTQFSFSNCSGTEPLVISGTVMWTGQTSFQHQTNSVKTLRKTKSNDVNQWPGLILSSSTTRIFRFV